MVKKMRKMRYSTHSVAPVVRHCLFHTPDYLVQFAHQVSCHQNVTSRIPHRLLEFPKRGPAEESEDPGAEYEHNVHHGTGTFKRSNRRHRDQVSDQIEQKQQQDNG